MSAALLQTLERAAHRARRAADRHGAALAEADRVVLGAAFFRAESLARHAIRDAIHQVAEPHRTLLREQLEDEERHVAVFEAWLPEPPAPIPVPRPKHRPPAVWFTLLLINEVAGFCQFHMLAVLAGSPERSRQVDEVIADEERHIVRLAGWLAEAAKSPAQAEDIARIARGFRRKLPGRMGQFLPAEQLSALREDMARIIGDLLADVLPPAVRLS